MSERHGKDAARRRQEKTGKIPETGHTARMFSDAVEAAFVAAVLSKGFGVIPDPIEPWWSYGALGVILGRESSTIQNWISQMPSKPPRHPVGPYYRLSDVLEAKSHAEEASER